MEGHLHKLGGRGLKASWKKRWFVIDYNNTLSYYINDEDSTPLGNIDLNQLEECGPAPQEQCIKSEFTFILKCAGVTHYLFAETKAAMDIWLQSIRGNDDNEVDNSIKRAEEEREKQKQEFFENARLQKRESAARLAEEEKERELQKAKEEAARIAKEEKLQMAKEEAARIAREENIQKAKEEAARIVREEKLQKAKEEAARIAREEKLQKAKEEAARIAREEKLQKAKEEAARIAQEEQMAKEEAAKVAREEILQKAKEEAARIAREEKIQKAKEEAARIAREEKIQRAKDEAARIAKEEKLQKAKEEAARIAKEQKLLKAREEAARIAKEEKIQIAKEEAAKIAKEEKMQKAKEEATRIANEEKMQKAKETAAKIAREEKMQKARTAAARIAKEEKESLLERKDNFQKEQAEKELEDAPRNRTPSERIEMARKAAIQKKESTDGNRVIKGSRNLISAEDAREAAKKDSDSAQNANVARKEAARKEALRIAEEYAKEEAEKADERRANARKEAEKIALQVSKSKTETTKSRNPVSSSQLRTLGSYDKLLQRQSPNFDNLWQQPAYSDQPAPPPSAPPSLVTKPTSPALPKKSTPFLQGTEDDLPYWKKKKMAEEEERKKELLESKSDDDEEVLTFKKIDFFSSLPNLNQDPWDNSSGKNDNNNGNDNTPTKAQIWNRDKKVIRPNSKSLKTTSITKSATSPTSKRIGSQGGHGIQKHRKSIASIGKLDLNAIEHTKPLTPITKRRPKRQNVRAPTLRKVATTPEYVDNASGHFSTEDFLDAYVNDSTSKVAAKKSPSASATRMGGGMGLNSMLMREMTNKAATRYHQS